MKKFFSKLLLVLIIVIMGLLATSVFANSFNDLEGFEYAIDYIEEFKEKGIISGTSETTFSPGNNVKREEFVKIIVNLFGYYNEEAECSYVDMSEEDWFYTYVASATEVGIINGIEDNKFGVGDNISRQDVCTIIYRVLNNKGYSLKKEKKTNLSFEDAEEISDYALEAVKLLYQAGIINGIDEKHFAPQSFCNRAAMVKISYLSNQKKVNKEEGPGVAVEEPGDGQDVKSSIKQEGVISNPSKESTIEPSNETTSGDNLQENPEDIIAFQK